MLTSTAGASRNNENLLFKTDPVSTVDFLKFPVVCCDDDHGYGKDKECLKCDCPPGPPGPAGTPGSIVDVSIGNVPGSVAGTHTFVPIKSGDTLAQSNIVFGLPTASANPGATTDSYIDITADQLFTSATQTTQGGQDGYDIYFKNGQGVSNPYPSLGYMIIYTKS